MKITNKYEMSKWAFEQYVEGNNTEEIEELITDPYWKFFYLYHFAYNKDTLKETK